MIESIINIISVIVPFSVLVIWCATMTDSFDDYEYM